MGAENRLSLLAIGRGFIQVIGINIGVKFIPRKGMLPNAYQRLKRSLDYEGQGAQANGGCGQGGEGVAGIFGLQGGRKMNRKQRLKRKQAIQEFQATKTARNKAHPDEHQDRIEQYGLERKQRLRRKEKRRLKEIKRKRILRLKVLRKRGEITVEEYQAEIKKLQKDKK